MITELVTKILTRESKAKEDSLNQYEELLEKAIQGKNCSESEIETIIRGAGKSPRDFITAVSAAKEQRDLEALAANYETLQKASSQAHKHIRQLEAQRDEAIKEAVKQVGKNYANKLDAARKDARTTWAELQKSNKAKDTLGINQREQEKERDKKRQRLQEKANRRSDLHSEILKAQNELESEDIDEPKRVSLLETLKRINKEHTEAVIASDELERYRG